MQKPSFQPFRQLVRSPSTPAYRDSIKYGTSTTINTSSSSIQSVDDEFRKIAIKWLMEFDRKVTKDTNYLSVWYLEIVLKNGLLIKESNWQLMAASIMLFASKMNQIYPPSINSIIKRCKAQNCHITRESIIQMEGKILNLLNFNVAIQSPYNLICQILKDKKKQIEECQKLLKIIIHNKDLNQQESQTLAYAIVYLISRNNVDSQLQGENRQKIKITAQKIYNYYKDIRRNYETQKQKEKQLASSQQGVIPNKKVPSQTSTKQNSKGGQSSLVGSYVIKKDDFVANKKPLSNDYIQQLHRANSYKYIPQKNALVQSTNGPQKEKKIFNCLSKDDLKENYKNLYCYS